MKGEYSTDLANFADHEIQVFKILKIFNFLRRHHCLEWTIHNTLPYWALCHTDW